MGVEDFKARARTAWAAGDFPRIARETVSDVGPAIVDAVGIRTGAKVLDVAAGSGATSIPAALAGGDVVASDLTPELLEAGRHAAIAAQVAIPWVEADAEALPFADASFDVVLSTFGAMFAPRHRVVADELLRVTRPGGTIALTTWTPAGFVGQMFMTMAPYAPALPDGASPPILWGDEDHVRALLGDGVTELAFERRIQHVTRFASPDELVDYYRAHLGPMIATFHALEPDPSRAAELDAELRKLAERTRVDGEWTFEYLQIIARRA
ncbi:MAG TPA: class I SAM-dependent methyltransferase [Baekduia sp.]|uniref:class I SAM-dependent methyltransferase n=1 Tax=Baekduia sp. TaxID=2600305 RepID=UPI002D76D65C|nr:class I SAM-dependent methyltransferase [Baekduia sp.]HET6505168.1 class I SAM-dependent methyltransferase [Baekduia sp.]